MIYKMPSMLFALTFSAQYSPLRFPRWAFILPALFFSALFFSPVASANQDANFLAAREAFRVGDAVRLDHIAARFKHSPLEPYIAYYQLRLRLTTANHATIRKFLSRTDDTQIINQLRMEWLKLLGQNQQWETFAAEYPKLTESDTELTCYAWQMRLAQQDFTVLNAVRDLWLSSSKELPENCAPLLKAARSNVGQTSGVITDADVMTHLRRALESSNIPLAMQLTETLPAQQVPTATALKSAARNPAYTLAQITFSPNTSTPAMPNSDMPNLDISNSQRVLAMFALQHLAKQSPQLAADKWMNLSSHFSAAEQRYFYSWLGYEAARKHDERALEWYRAAGTSSLTDTQIAWRTRAALRAQDWQEVLLNTSSMSPAQQQETAWKYWKARALRALGKTAEAEIIFSEFSDKFDFYGQLAAEEIGRVPAVNMIFADVNFSSAEVEAMRALPSIQRVVALYRMDLRTEAAKEWTWVTRSFDDKKLLLAAEVARLHKMHDHVINTADRTVHQHNFSLRFHAPYRPNMQQHIHSYGLEEAWVYGLMRQESRFVSRAKSVVGAAGVMQIMPATARWAAQKIGMKNYQKSSIHEMDTNFKLGTYYMKSMLSSLDDSPVLASAAYNAGPNRARKWRAKQTLEGAIYIETIPFDETRQYVKKVMNNTVYYAKLFGHSPMQLKQRLGVVAAAEAAVESMTEAEKPLGMIVQ